MNKKTIFVVVVAHIAFVSFRSLMRLIGFLHGGIQVFITVFEFCKIGLMPT